MILINKDKEYNNIIVNASDTIGYGEYIITLYSHYTKREFMFNLFDDISTSPVRYNEFRINTLQFDKIDDGDYVYTITQQDTIKDTGMLKVFSHFNADIYTSRQDESEDFYVYEP